MKNYLVFFSVLLSFGVFAAESYPELMDQAEKLMNRRYEKGTRAYKIKSAELDEILESKETREEKIARLKKFIAEFQPAQTVQTSGAAVSKEQIWQYLKDIRQCEKEAENGDSVAQLALGLHYMNLENPKRDPAVALEWAQRAAQSGIPSATMLVGLIYLEGGNGVVRKPAEGLQLVKSAASQGCVEAMSVLGNLYSRGRLVPMDKSAALMWYRKAAENGDAASMYLTGRAYDEGSGTGKDEIQALHWYRKAAENNWRPAFMTLGQMYYQGRGTAVNYPEAFRWFERASKENTEAFAMLGEMYMTAKGVPRDDAKAMECFKKCMKNKPLNQNAAFHLASLYYKNGDFSNAEDCFKKAVGTVPMSNFFLGEMAFKQKKHDEAMT